MRMAYVMAFERPRDGPEIRLLSTLLPVAYYMVNGKIIIALVRCFPKSVIPGT
jgi:hypothetical protein